MNNIYKVILSGKNIYEEVDLLPDLKSLLFGTGMDCQYRVHRDLFFEDFYLSFVNDGESWSVECSDNLYFYVGDIRKLSYRQLDNGDVFTVRYQASNADMLTIEFLVNFDYEVHYINRKVSLEQTELLRIGKGSNDHIVLRTAYIDDDEIELIRVKDGYQVNVIRTEFGVCINGIKISGSGHLQNKDFLSVADVHFYYSEPFLWTEARSDVFVNHLKYHDEKFEEDYPRFTRNARVKKVLDTEQIEILDPPSKPQKPKTNLFLSLLPSMGMLVTSGLLASQGGSMLLYSGISGGMAIITSIATLISNNKDFKKESADRIEKYNRYAEEKRKSIEEYRKQERKELQEIYIDTEKEQSLLDSFSSALFDRSARDEDFLSVRLGTGTIEAQRKIDYKKQEKLEVEDDLQLIPEKIAEEFKYIDHVPVVCELKKAGAAAVIGKEKYRFAMFKNMVFDLSLRHFPSEAEFYFVASEKNQEKVNWLRFLPHVNTENGLRNIVTDDESKSRIFDSLYKELSSREKDKEAKQLVIFVYDDFGLQNHPLSRFIENAGEVCASFIFFVDKKGKAPVGCTQLIYLDEEGKGTLVLTEDEKKKTDFTYREIETETVREMVSRLAPVYKEEISLEGALTKNISLFQMLGIFSVSDISLEQRWASSAVYKSMAAPVGVTKNGIISLDLHDKAHGPHGLVAGTTGSGKSELLQTYILSMATLFHPYEVAFVIIDFKGGGMVNQFKNLPHLLGAITNIDGKEINRSLKSIKAELQKRQRLFAEADVNHIDKYIQKYKAGQVSVPIPHLVLIVDEFAELKQEQPDFMAELISAARIGRSLGVHLILATQKPSGQVDDQIWSNSRFKLCLKVQDESDSNEVLKSPLAAEIKEPGRAYLQVGNNEIFELFQSAYSGAPERVSDSSTKEFAIYKVNSVGLRTEIYSQKKAKEGALSVTQLEAVVNYVNQYCTDNRISRLPDICLPSLPEKLFNHEPEKQKLSGVFDIGLYDDPDNQIQDSTLIDFAGKHTFILGSSQYGKTNLLQSLIRSVAESSSPAESVIYILDFGSMVLKNFENLKHVGGVVTSAEDEKLKNLLKLIHAEINERKARLLEAGVSSHSAYLEAGFKDLPHIYLLVDNVSALLELYLEDDDSLLTILREGLAVGISVVMTNQVTNGVSYRYLSNFANKMSFYCNDSMEYGSLFDHVTLEPDDVPGRCVFEEDKRMLECQTYLAFEGEREIDRVNAIKEFISQINQEYADARVKHIPSIPAVLTKDILVSDFLAQTKGYSIPIGLTYKDVEPFYLDISDINIMGLCGKEGTGHTNFVNLLMGSLNANMSDYPVNVYVFDDIKRKLSYLKGHPAVKEYTISPDNAESVFRSWHDILEERYDEMSENGETAKSEFLLMLVQNNELAKVIEDDMELTELYNDIVDRYKGLNAAILFTDYPNTSVSYDSPEILRRIKDDQHLLFFEDLENLKPFDVSYEDLRANKKKIGKGDAYYIQDNSVIKLKIVKAEED